MHNVSSDHTLIHERALRDNQRPSLPELTEALSSLLHTRSQDSGKVEVVSRSDNVYTSTFQSELVTCRLHDMRELTLFCKYGVDHEVSSSVIRGVPYEANVYTRILDNIKVSTPNYMGSFTVETNGETCLVLEYLTNYVRVNHSTTPNALSLAARWLGQFHRHAEQTAVYKSWPGLNQYNADYFTWWVRQALVLPSALVEQHPWLSELCEQLEKVTALLMAGKTTVIHGELYPANCMIHGHSIRIVDWESAGTGAGELDLATLTFGPWPVEMVSECETQYQLARWPKGTPRRFDAVLTAAKLYTCFQFMHDRLRFQPERLRDEPWLFDTMLVTAKQLELLGASS